MEENNIGVVTGGSQAEERCDDVALHGVKVRVKVLYFSNIVYYLNFSLK
jgi:hypothetical protein